MIAAIEHAQAQGMTGPDAAAAIGIGHGQLGSVCARFGMAPFVWPRQREEASA
jgi:hypothetical protein